MTEQTSLQAFQQANETMDAIYVDDNNEAFYLPDLLNQIETYEAGEDHAAVLVEASGEGKLVLTRMEDGYRSGHYGNILNVDHPEAAQYE